MNVRVDQSWQQSLAAPVDNLRACGSPHELTDALNSPAGYQDRSWGEHAAAIEDADVADDERLGGRE